MEEEVLFSVIPPSSPSNQASRITPQTSTTFIPTDSSLYKSTIASSKSTGILTSSDQSNLPNDQSDHLTNSQILTHSSPSSEFIVQSDSSNISCDYPWDCFLTANAKINDSSGIVLLDTGSGVTIISSHRWKLIDPDGLITPDNE